MVNAYAQDLGIQSRELAGIGFVRRDLACSDGCPGFREEHQDDVLAEIVAQLDVLIQVGWQLKIWCRLPNV
jgi:hypothetical protein